PTPLPVAERCWRSPCELISDVLLTSRGTPRILFSTSRKESRHAGPSARTRSPPRQYRPPRPQSPCPRAYAWVGHWTSHRADLTRTARGESRLALSRPPATRASRLDRQRMAVHREQSPGALLHTHHARTKGSRRRSR